jgi:prepilin-type processing-associated H-X9-DG protein
MGITNYKGCTGSNWGYNGNSAFTTNFPVSDPAINPPQDGLDHGNGIMYRVDGARKLTWTKILDGSSNTFMIGESMHTVDQHCGGWGMANYCNATCAIPLNYNDVGKTYSNWPNRYSFHSNHGGGANFCFGDGAVRFVADSINLNTYRGLATIKGGETVNPEEL